MRSLADGRIRWGFFPPDSQVDRTGKGIWLGGEDDQVNEEEVDEDPGAGDGDLSSEELEDLVSSDLESDIAEGQNATEADLEGISSDDDGARGRKAPGGFFAALDIDDTSSNESEAVEAESLSSK